MAWMTSNIYLCSGDQGRVADAAADLLGSGRRRRDLTGILDPPPPVVVSPPLDGWVAVSGGSGWLDDLVWASGELSRAVRARGASVELIGNSYRLRRSVHEDGRQELISCTPDHGWGGAADDPRDMPLYEDCEALAFRFLVELGVPLPLITLGTTPLGCPPQHELELGLAVHLSPGVDRGEVRRAEAPCQAAAFDGADPPTLPTSISRDFGTMLFEERYVEGAPGARALDRLMEIEQALLDRARRAHPGGEVSLTVTYHGSVNQPLLDEMLRARDRLTLTDEQRMRPPWWAFWRHLGRFS